MSFFKKPVVAVLLAAIIVLSSSYLTAASKLSKASDKVTDGFYRGVEYDGYKHKSIYSQLDNICGAVSGLITIAKSHGIDTAELSRLNGELSSSISAKHDNISSIHTRYTALYDSLNSLLGSLSDTELSSREQKGLEEYSSTIKGAVKVIDEAGYNESVHEFFSDMSWIPANFFISITGIHMPETFA